MITFEAPFLPRCLGRNGTIGELFSSPLPAGALYADHSLHELVRPYPASAG